MVKKSLLISVIIPVYNYELYLAEAIESVMAQTYRPIEVIVIDDGSTDNSAEVAKRFSPPVKYFYKNHCGAGAARNHGVDLAQGSFLAFLDADDIWMQDKLTLQIAVFQSNPGVDFVFGHVQQFISPELDDNHKNKIYCPAEKMPGFVASTMLIKRESIVSAGAFETNLQIGEFIDWYLKAKEYGLKSIMLPDVVSKRRIHANNQSIREKKFQSDFVKIIKKSLDRRRIKK